MRTTGSHHGHGGAPSAWSPPSAGSDKLPGIGPFVAVGSGKGRDEAGVPRSPDDLAENAGIRPAEAPRLLLLAEAASLHAPLRNGEATLEDFLADEAALQPLDVVIQSEIIDGVRHPLARLEPREAYVLRLRYGIGTGAEHTTADTSRQLGLSRERVRRIEADALEHMRERRYWRVSSMPTTDIPPMCASIPQPDRMTRRPERRD